LIKKDLKHGKFSNIISKLKEKGIADLRKRTCREQLISKFPSEEKCFYEKDVWKDNISDSDTAGKYIWSKKRGAAKGLTGHSTDHLQDLVRIVERAQNNLYTVFNWIARGRVVDNTIRSGSC
jgi:hypothetical protein